MKNSKIIYDFTQNMSSLLCANLTVNESLEICASVNKNCSSLCKYLLKEISAGTSLASAIEKCDFVNFPPYYKNLVNIAQSSGEISSVFEKLFSYLQAEKKNREKILQSLLYPLFVIFSTICVAFFILIYVYPKFSAILSEFSLSSSELDFSMKKNLVFIRVSIYVFFMMIFMLFCIFCVYKKSENGRFVISKIILHLPGIGRYISYICTKNLVFSLGLLCKNGMSFVEALKCASGAVSNCAFSRQVQLLSLDLASGKSLSESLEKCNFFPENFSSFLKISERTGNLSDCFTQMESYFCSENDIALSRFLSFLEPFFILLAGILLLILVMQLVLPIFNALGGAI